MEGDSKSPGVEIGKQATLKMLWAKALAGSIPAPGTNTMQKPLIFLGGTVAHNEWRSGFIAKLAERGIPEEYFFNPVVRDWDDAARAREEEAKTRADYLIFYIGDPQQTGDPLSADALVEATMALYDKSERTAVMFDTEGMRGHPLKVVQQVRTMLTARFPRAHIFATRDTLIDWLIAQCAQ